jgi:acid phosphatase (class A)
MAGSILNRISLAAAAAATLLAAGAAALAQAPATAPAKTTAPAPLGPPKTSLTGYLEAGVLDGKAILGPPPAADSAQGRADRTIFEETRGLKDSPRWRTAIQDNDLWQGGALKRFACAIGVRIDAAQTPVLFRMLHRIELDVRTVGTPAKDFYDRKRPLIGNDLPICIPREKWMETNASYPSGHSMTAWAWALILAEADPAKASQALAVGKDSGDSRVVCGVHFLSDVEAGRTLGAGMVARLHAVPAFNADMAAAKAELEVATAPPEGC